MSSSDDDTGFLSTPDRYKTRGGREAIDLIRDSMSDQEFIAHCRGTALKYDIRLGKKKSPDVGKSAWYKMMAVHVAEPERFQDPRSQRPGFLPYQRASIPDALPARRIDVLDHGFVRLVETWGGGDARLSEAGIIEAARQSTQGNFRGWASDRRLLRYLYHHKHSTPFEFGGMVVEVRAPLFVFREWHRHRTQSYNEMSARYSPLPSLFYTPTVDRVMLGSVSTANSQAGVMDGADPLTDARAARFLSDLDHAYATFEEHYSQHLSAGVPKELARLSMPVGQYSQMRASANLRNWLGFLTLRLDTAAQWEIRQYAKAVLELVRGCFPETAELFQEP